MFCQGTAEKQYFYTEQSSLKKNKARLFGDPNNFQAYKKIKKLVQKECRIAHNNYLANVIVDQSAYYGLTLRVRKKTKLELDHYATMTKYTLMIKTK